MEYSNKLIELHRIQNKIEKMVLSPFPIPDPLPSPSPSEKSFYSEKWILVSCDISDEKILVNEALVVNWYCYYFIKDINNILYADGYNLDSYYNYSLTFLIKTYANNLVKEMNDIERLKHQLLFISRLSVNYHSKAEKFYINIANIATYLAVILSAGSIVALSDMFSVAQINLKPIGGGFALIVLGVNGAILAYGVPYKANIHAGFRTQWIKLLGNIQKIEPIADNYDLLKSLESDSFLMHEQEPVIVKKWELSADHLTRINMGLPQHKHT